MSLPDFLTERKSLTGQDLYCLDDKLKITMPCPPFHRFLKPTLIFLSDGIARHRNEIKQMVVAQMGLSSDEVNEMLASGKQTKADNRAGWALAYLSQSGLIASSEKRGFWKITEVGAKFLKRAPEHIKPADLEEFEGFREFKKRERRPEDQYSVLESDKTPHEEIESAYRVLNDSLASDLLSRMTQMSPKRFELLIISLMLRLGYGRGEEDAGFHVGQSGDEGIDGIISEDKLGLDKIYLQAKRWKNGSVGRPDVQAFVGALSSQRAIKGVFITRRCYELQRECPHSLASMRQTKAR